MEYFKCQKIGRTNAEIQTHAKSFKATSATITISPVLLTCSDQIGPGPDTIKNSERVMLNF